MALYKCKLGEFIEEITRKNNNLQYGINSVRGISNTKEIMKTKADVDESVLHKFYVIMPNEFVYNPRTTRMGEKVGLGYNNTCEILLFSFNNIAFRLKNDAEEKLSSDWLYIFFNRSEFDRYAMIHSWGSATELFSFDEMCNIEIDLPPLPIQQKYVDIYKAMVANQQAYERGLEDLKNAVFAEIEQIKHSAPRMRIADILEEIDVRNKDGKITNIQGININKSFMPSVADTTGVNINNYKVVKKGQFAFSSMQTGRDECIRIALFDQDSPIVISPAYSVLINKSNSVLSEYVMLWFMRSETDRYGWFASDASIRTNLEMERFLGMEIPVPNKSTQTAITEIYHAFIMRKSINERLKAQIRDICPILIKGSIEEARGA